MTATPRPPKAVLGGLWLASAALLALGAVATTFVGDSVGTAGFDPGPEVGADAVRRGAASVRYQVTVGTGTAPPVQQAVLVTDLGTGRSRIDTTAQIGAVRLRLRGVATPDSVYFEESPSRPLPGGASWLRVGVHAAGGAGVRFPTGDDHLDLFGSERSEVGPEVVDGRQTVRWRVTVPPDRVVRHPVQAVIGGLFLGGAPERDHELWLDTEGLPRRHRAVSTPRGEQLTVETTFTYHRPHRFEIPADGVHEADDAQEVLALMGGATAVSRPALGATSEAADAVAQAELRQGLTVEKVYFADHRRYAADRLALEAMPAPVEMAVSPDGQVVCLTRRSASGAVFVIADVASGPEQGTRYGRAPLPQCTRQAVAALASSW